MRSDYRRAATGVSAVRFPFAGVLPQKPQSPGSEDVHIEPLIAVAAPNGYSEQEEFHGILGAQMRYSQVARATMEALHAKDLHL